jgi:hypothetical protein
MIALRIEQAQAVLELAQVLGFRQERLNLTIVLPRQVVIDGIQQFAKYVHFALSSAIYCTASLSAFLAKDLDAGLHCCYAIKAWNSRELAGRLEERNEQERSVPIRAIAGAVAG